MYRHENHSPFGEIRRFETKIGDLRESCRFDEKMFKGGEGGVSTRAWCRMTILEK